MARRSAIVLSVSATLAALGVGLLATPASAVTAYHFKLFEKASYHGFTNKGFRFKGGLFDRQDRDNRVGSDHGRCKFRPHDTEFCKGTSHLDGEIGGVGDIEYRGHNGVGRPLNVVGGSDDFDGATGTVGFRDLNRAHTKSMNAFDFVVP